jgi:hypothetical protein
MLKIIIGFIIWIIMMLGIVAFIRGATSYEYDKEDLE